MSWVQGVNRMFPGTLGGQSRVATPRTPQLVVPRIKPPTPYVPTFQTVTFNYTGSVQTFTVPLTLVPYSLSPTPSMIISPVAGSAAGGARTGFVFAEVPCTPGETLYVYVGQRNGNGANRQAGGWNGGGSGGNGDTPGRGGAGASDVRRGGTALADRIIVAGGIAGDSPGVASSSPDGDDGNGSIADPGATQSAGGSTAFGGTAGSLGVGGDGADDPTTPFGQGGAGAGGGYYGGGGGSPFFNSAGGGSSWVDPSAFDVGSGFYHHVLSSNDGKVDFEFYA